MRTSIITSNDGYGGADGRASTRISRFVKGTVTPKPPNNDGHGLMAMLTHPLCLLLLSFPLGIVSDFVGWGSFATFSFNFLALIPLAKILGDATEELAAGLKNDMLAGLLNATFGNAVEMVMMIQTMRAGMIPVVKATLLGSILSNLLLVLGMSFLCGGLVSQVKKNKLAKVPNTYSEVGRSSIVECPEEGDSSLRQRVTQKKVGRDSVSNVDQDQITTSPAEQAEHEETFAFAGEVVQTFSVMSALVNTSMLLLSCLSFSLVTVFYAQTRSNYLDEHPMDGVLIPVSRICSIISMLAYGAYIVFQLVTHREALSEGDKDADGEGEDEEEPTLSITSSIMVMLVVTVFVAVSSEFLVRNVEGCAENARVSMHFIGIILLPIVGNACEHASAIRFAVMDKPGLSIGIAIGSSTQISLFVVPFSVIMGWVLEQPMDLNFGQLNTTVMCMSVVVVLSVVVDGMANWLQGYLLMSAYFIIAVLYWHLPDVDSPHSAPKNVSA